MSESAVTRICSWSGPRSVSTALMYAFAQRADTRVVDEPLYARYLAATGADHPGRGAVLEAQSTDAGEVVREVILGPVDRPVLFVKNMAHHMVGVDRSFLARLTNLFLIRDPRDALISLAEKIPRPEMRDTGYRALHELFEHVTDRLGREPIVVDARDLRNRPRAVLSAVCERAGIGFDPAMLSWEAGPRPEDGVWAEHWYGAVHASTGFRPYEPKDEEVPDRLSGLLDACLALYGRMAEHAIRPGGEADDGPGAAADDRPPDGTADPDAATDDANEGRPTP